MIAREAIPGLYQAGRLAYCYLIEDAQSGLILVDTGMPDNVGMIERVLAEKKRSVEEIRHILITHADTDHVGSLGQLVERTGAQVYASQQSAEYIQNRTIPEHLPLFVQSVKVLQTRLLENLADVDNVVNDNEVLDLAGGIRVIPTPGHTPDHVSYFWEREKVLFAGDLIGHLNGELGVSPDAVTHDKEALHQSVRRVLRLNPRVICPAHGEVWLADNDPTGLKTLADLVKV